jgi:hypothetical protein
MKVPTLKYYKMLKRIPYSENTPYYKQSVDKDGLNKIYNDFINFNFRWIEWLYCAKKK